jgi:hypothetical protein
MQVKPLLRRLPGGRLSEATKWVRVVAEVILLVFVLVIFGRLHAALGTDVAAATDNAHAVQALERRVHVDVELAFNGFLAGHRALITPAVLVYRLYYAVLAGVLVWILLRHDDVYLHVRRTFVAMTGLALVAYWAVPMSPPRFALAGTVDIVAEHAILGRHVQEANGFSAMPSLHVGWSAWAAYAVWLALREAYPRGSLLPWLFPIVMVVVVFATGNHYVLDVVGSAALLVASVLAARAWGRLVHRARPGITETTETHG